MKQVNVSFTGEVLCKELVEEISKIKQLQHSATFIRAACLEYHGFSAGTLKQQYNKRMHLKLKETATKVDFDRIIITQKEMELLVEKHSKLKAVDLDSIQFLHENKTMIFLYRSFCQSSRLQP